MIREGDSIRLTEALDAEDCYHDEIVQLPVGQVGLVVDTLGGRACEFEFMLGDMTGDDCVVVIRTVEFDQCEPVMEPCGDISGAEMPRPHGSFFGRKGNGLSAATDRV